MYETVMRGGGGENYYCREGRIDVVNVLFQRVKIPRSVREEKQKALLNAEESVQVRKELERRYGGVWCVLWRANDARWGI